MVDYNFYCNEYLGSLISPKAFPEMARQAEDALSMLKRKYRVTSSGEESEKLALCAMAEAIFRTKRRGAVSAATVGSVSVRYDGENEKDLKRELYRCAAIYLDIYRGVSAR